MLITIIAPEMLLAKNWQDLVDAKESLTKIKALAEKDNVPWTLAHSHFANMGGFAIRCNTGSKHWGRTLEIDRSSTHSDLQQNTMKPEISYNSAASNQSVMSSGSTQTLHSEFQFEPVIFTNVLGNDIDLGDKTLMYMSISTAKYFTATQYT